ncbi:MAG: hypothetical protein QXP68_07035, partial [Thermosphaera sp.]
LIAATRDIDMMNALVKPPMSSENSSPIATRVLPKGVVEIGLLNLHSVMMSYSHEYRMFEKHFFNLGHLV